VYNFFDGVSGTILALCQLHDFVSVLEEHFVGLFEAYTTHDFVDFFLTFRRLFLLSLKMHTSKCLSSQHRHYHLILQLLSVVQHLRPLVSPILLVVLLYGLFSFDSVQHLPAFHLVGYMFLSLQLLQVLFPVFDPVLDRLLLQCELLFLPRIFPEQHSHQRSHTTQNTHSASLSAMALANLSFSAASLASWIAATLAATASLCFIASAFSSFSLIFIMQSMRFLASL
jgi:hypothetical protein